MKALRVMMMLSSPARITRPRLDALPLFFAAASLLADAAPAAACAVCFGDPESPMAKGATAGVLFLVGVVTTVLAGIAGTAMFWTMKARRIAGHGAKPQ